MDGFSLFMSYHIQREEGTGTGREKDGGRGGEGEREGAREGSYVLLNGPD